MEKNHSARWCLKLGFKRYARRPGSLRILHAFLCTLDVKSIFLTHKAFLLRIKRERERERERERGERKEEKPVRRVSKKDRTNLPFSRTLRYTFPYVSAKRGSKRQSADRRAQVITCAARSKKIMKDNRVPRHLSPTGIRQSNFVLPISIHSSLCTLPATLAPYSLCSWHPEELWKGLSAAASKESTQR